LITDFKGLFTIRSAPVTTGVPVSAPETQVKSTEGCANFRTQPE